MSRRSLPHLRLCDAALNTSSWKASAVGWCGFALTTLSNDLAAAMKLAVLVVTQNQLGCLNHAALTVRSVAEHELRCVGLVLNAAQLRDDVAVLTNADILKRILKVPLLVGLGENLTELPVGG